MTETSTTCEFSKCSTEAEVLKYEAREVADEDGELSTTKVAVKMCRACADEQYDGTEEFPKLYKLS